jgi:hypothetical protein
MEKVNMEEQIREEKPVWKLRARDFVPFNPEHYLKRNPNHLGYNPDSGVFADVHKCDDPRANRRYFLIDAYNNLCGLVAIGGAIVAIPGGGMYATLKLLELILPAK